MSLDTKLVTLETLFPVCLLPAANMDINTGMSFDKSTDRLQQTGHRAIAYTAIKTRTLTQVGLHHPYVTEVVLKSPLKCMEI